MLRPQISGPSADSVTLEWTSDLAKVSTTPVADEETLYVTAGDDAVHAIDRATGEERWQAPSPFGGFVRLAGDTLYAGSTFRLTAIHAPTGEVTWTIEHDPPVGFAPLVAGNRLYYPGDGITVRDPGSGDIIDTVDLPQQIRSQLMLHDGSLVVGTADPPELSTGHHDDGHVRQLDATTLDQKWATALAEEPYPAVAWDTGTVYVGGEVPAVAALAPTDGTIQWQTTVETKVTRPVVGTDHVYAGTMNGDLIAFDRATGREAWRFEKPGDAYDRYARVPFVLKGTTVYAPNFDGTLYAVDSTTGELEWQFRADDRLVSGPVVDADSLYVASEGGTLYALELSN